MFNQPIGRLVKNNTSSGDFPHSYQGVPYATIGRIQNVANEDGGIWRDRGGRLFEAHPASDGSFSRRTAVMVQQGIEVSHGSF